MPESSWPSYGPAMVYEFQALQVSVRTVASESPTDRLEIWFSVSTNSSDRPWEACQAMWQWTSLERKKGFR